MKESRTIPFLIGTLVVLSVGIWDETLHPFFSITFLLALSSAYYFAVNSRVQAAAIILSSLFLVQLLQALGRSDQALTVFLIQSPIYLLFYSGIATLPGLLPSILIYRTKTSLAEVSRVKTRCKEIDAKLASERKEKVSEKGAESRQAVLRLTSRITQIQAFVREVLQAASTKEILGLLFNNVTKTFGAQEVALLTVLEDGQAVITKAAHPDYEALENQRVEITNLPIFAPALSRPSPVLLPERTEFAAPNLGALAIQPVQIEGKTVALITVGKHRGEGEQFAPGDMKFLATLADIAARATSQLKVVLDS